MCQAQEGSTAASSAGSASRSTARRRFFARVLDPVQKSSWEASSRTEAARGASSASGLSTWGIPSAALAITSASMRSVLATPASASRRAFSADPGR